MDRLNIPSSLILSLDVTRSIQSQLSITYGVDVFLRRSLNDEFSNHFKKVWELSLTSTPILMDAFKPLQKPLVQLLIKGRKGLAIYDELQELQTEMICQCEEDIDLHVQKLPLKLQMPLLLLIFPAILILVLIPALKLLQMSQ